MQQTRAQAVLAQPTRPDIAPFELRKWQKEAVNRSIRKVPGIFLEAAGGKGKTICALAICKFKKAKSILILNNRTTILQGWKDSVKTMEFDEDVHIECMTDRKFQNLQKQGRLFDVDVLIIDEWQNMSSDNLIKAYAKVYRKYTIGLSATPMRKAGLNFYGLEKTLWKKANPNNKWNWRAEHGKLVEDRFAYSGYKWSDFKNYEDYISKLPNFMSYAYIDQLENAVVNNGFKTRRYTKKIPAANPKLIDIMLTYNVVTIGKHSVMPKLHFGVNSYLRYLNSAVCDIELDSSKGYLVLMPQNKPSPLLTEIKRAIKACPTSMLIVTKSVHLATIIHKQNKGIGLWTGMKKIDIDKNIVVATQQTLGVGVDGLQHQFENIMVLDPVSPDSGEYDDYRQLLWRVTGSRQQHDVNLIEIHFI